MKIKGGELYFIRENDVRTGELTPYVKIGIVRDKSGDERTSEDRALEHQTGNPRKLFVESIIKTPSVTEIENIIHNLYAEERIYGEWFDFSAEQFISVKKMAMDLVQMAIDNQEKFEIAESLSSTASKDETIEPKPEIIEWHSKLLAAEVRVKECVALQAEIKDAFKTIIAAPVETGTQKEKQEALAPYVKVQEKKAKLEFDLNAFMEARPELYAEFTKVVRTAPKGSFTITRPKDLVFELSKIDIALFQYSNEVKEELVKYQTGKVSQEELHTASLKLLGFEAKASWDKEIAQANLKSYCQDYAGIEGLCKWKRESKETLSFDKAALIEAHPKIAEKFMTEVEVAPAIIMQKKRAYPKK
ncbi:Bacteriophage T5, Orf172 DNA-binding [actinobacterium SCGC AAA044-D11]